MFQERRTEYPEPTKKAEQVDKKMPRDLEPRRDVRQKLCFRPRKLPAGLLCCGCPRMTTGAMTGCYGVRGES